MMRRAVSMSANVGIEPMIWLAALLWLGLSEPEQFGDFTFCPLSNLGITICPGCGLGRSVSYALHGQFTQSLQAHVLAIPAICILSFRILSLLKHTLTVQLRNSHSSQPKGLP